MRPGFFLQSPFFFLPYLHLGGRPSFLRDALRTLRDALRSERRTLRIERRLDLRIARLERRLDLRTDLRTRRALDLRTAGLGFLPTHLLVLGSRTWYGLHGFNVLRTERRALDLRFICLTIFYYTQDKNKNKS